MHSTSFLDLAANKNPQLVNFIIIYEQCIPNVLKISTKLESTFRFHICIYTNITLIWTLKTELDGRYTLGL